MFLTCIPQLHNAAATLYYFLWIKKSCQQKFLLGSAQVCVWGSLKLFGLVFERQLMKFVYNEITHWHVPFFFVGSWTRAYQGQWKRSLCLEKMQPKKGLENRLRMWCREGPGLCPWCVVWQSWVCQRSPGVMPPSLAAAFESSAVAPCLGDCLSEAWAELSPICLYGSSLGLAILGGWVSLFVL